MAERITGSKLALLSKKNLAQFDKSSQWLNEFEFYGQADKEYLKPGIYYVMRNDPYDPGVGYCNCIFCGIVASHNYEWELETELEADHV